MGWYAKPRGGWSTEDNEAQQNMFMISEYLQNNGWTMIAIAGLLGNMANESGFNPWRWNSDTVGLNTRAYGLVQFYPASYYIGGRGTESMITNYSPNMSTSSQTAGATPQDGLAQLQVMEIFHSDKFFNRASYCHYADISGCYPYTAFKTQTDLWLATVGWLFNYEFPAASDREYADAYSRYQKAIRCYEIITGSPPPEPPDPPVPPTPTTRPKPPLFFYCIRKFRQKKGLLV